MRIQTPEHMALRQERYQQLHAVISKLPELQQQLLPLRFGDGLRVTLRGTSTIRGATLHTPFCNSLEKMPAVSSLLAFDNLTC